MNMNFSQKWMLNFNIEKCKTMHVSKKYRSRPNIMNC